MNNESMKTIRFSGMDYSNRFRELFQKNFKQDPDKGDLFYPHEGVTFDLSDLYADTPQDRESLGEIAADKNNVIACTENGDIGFIIAQKKLEAIQARFRKADVLLFSGHHYGADYYANDVNNFFAPGLTSRLEFEEFYKGSGYIHAPAFHLGALTHCNDTPYDNVKLIVSTSCNVLRENALHLYQKLFPKALILGYHGRAPMGTQDEFLLQLFFLGLPWEKRGTKAGLLDEGLSEDSFKYLLTGIWTRAINASHTRLSEPGYYRAIGGKWEGASVNPEVHMKSDGYEFNALGKPKAPNVKVQLLLDVNLQQRVRELNEKNQ